MSDFPQFEALDFIAPAAILGIIFLLSRTRLASSFSSPIFNRLIVFALGSVSLLLSAVLRQESLVPVRLDTAAAAGTEWLVVYEMAIRVKPRLGRNRIWQFLAPAGLMWMLGGLVYLAVSALFSWVLVQLSPSLAAVPGDIQGSALAMARYGLGGFRILDAVTFAGVTLCLASTSEFSINPGLAHFRQASQFGGTGGFQDMEMSASKSHTTRLLCASVFLGGGRFRRQVLQFLDDPNRAVAPELGTDLRLVAQVCKFARDRDNKFEWFFAACIVLALLASIVDPSFGIFCLVLAGACVYLLKAWPERFDFVRAFAKPIFQPEKVTRQFAAQLEPEHLTSLPADDQNLIVYQGFSPFVGAGTSLGGWSFVVNIDKGKDDTGVELEPQRFQTAELYAEIDRSLLSLGLNGLSQRDTFFVHGSDIRDDRTILPNSYGRPVQTIDPARAEKYLSSNDPHVRHYKWIRVMDWGNELTTSYLLRCTLRGNHLFVEINRYLLTPLATPYRTVDAVAEEDWHKRVAVVATALILGPLKALFSPLMLLARLQEYLADMFDQKAKHRRDLIDDNPLYNYGVARSFRQETSSDQFMHYFQKLDGDFYSKVLEREILSAIVGFLDEHNIDTSELKERQSTILNSGIIIHGGDVKAESLAVGTGAQAVQVSRSEPSPKSKLRRAAAGAP